MESIIKLLIVVTFLPLITKRSRITKDIEQPDQAILEFTAWEKKIGIYRRKVVIKATRTGMRGVFAKEHINPDEELINIPLRAIITQEYPTNDPIIKKARRYLREIDLLVVTVHQEIHNPNTLFKPYFDLWPESVDNFPLFFNQSQFDLLQGTSVINFIHIFIDEMNHRYENIRRVLPELNNFTLTDFYKYSMLCISRCLMLNINGRKQTVFVPSYDMINTFPYTNQELHTVGTAYKDRHPGEPYVTLRARKEIKEGDEVHIYYRGDYTNTEYLIHYGFMFKEVSDVSLQIRLKLEGEYIEAKKQIFKHLPDAYVLNDSVLVNMKNASSNASYWSLVNTAQILEVNDENELNDILDYVKNERSVAFAREDTRAAMNRLMNAINNLLSNYPTTIEEDEELMLDYYPHSTTHSLIQIRLDEKRTLKKILKQIINNGDVY